MNRRQALVLRSFAAWTVWVWGTRIWNIVTDGDHSIGFKVVHSLLAAVSIAFALAAWRIVRTLRTAD